MPQHASVSLATHQRRLLNEIDYSVNTVETFKSEVAEAKDFLEMMAAVNCHHGNMSSAFHKINHSVNMLLAGSVSTCSNATLCDEVHRRRFYSEIEYIINTLNHMRRNIAEAENFQQMYEFQRYYAPVITSAVQTLVPFEIILTKGAPSLARCSNIPVETVRGHLINQADYLGSSLKLLREEVADADSMQDIANSVTHYDKRILPIIKVLATPAQLQEKNEAEEIIKSSTSNGRNFSPVTGEFSKKKEEICQRWKPPEGVIHSNSSISADEEDSEIKSGRKHSKYTISSVVTKKNIKRGLEDGTGSSVQECRNAKKGRGDANHKTGAIVLWVPRDIKHSYGFIHAGKIKYYFKERSLVGNFNLQRSDTKVNIPVTFDILPTEWDGCDEAVNIRRRGR